MPERLQSEVQHKVRYINTLTCVTDFNKICHRVMIEFLTLENVQLQ